MPCSVFTPPSAGRRTAGRCTERRAPHGERRAAPSMNFSSKKRARGNAWKDLQKELDEREKVEEENQVEMRKKEKLIHRVTVEEELNPKLRYGYMDIEIGRRMGRDPRITSGRIIFELFDDIMPRTVEKFCQMLENEHEVLGLGFGF